MNKLEICITELYKDTDGVVTLGVKAVGNLECSRKMRVEFFRTAFEALERIDKNVFMDALELYLKEKSGK